jgi:hypothetical protein
MIRKTTLAVLGLAASSFAVAGTMGPVCAPGNVTVPCVTNQWDIGIQALYLKSVFDGNKAYQPSVATLGNFTAIDNDWDWGSRLEGSYHFNTGNDISFNWTHYQNNIAQAGLFGVLPTQQISGYTFFGDNLFDQVNLVLGQHVDVSASKKMRFYGGLQYAHISANGTRYYALAPAALAPLGITAVNQFDDADYKGVGPAIGLDYAYYLTNEFSVTANGAGSVLYGTSRFNNGFVGNTLPSNVIIAQRFGDRKMVVPSLEAKLGLNYAYNMAQGTLNLEGGYQVMNYFNALTSAGPFGFGSTLSDSDYGLYGPYFGLKYVGNA